MKIRDLIILLFVFFSSSIVSLSDELDFDADKIDIKNDGNYIIAQNVSLSIPSKNILLKSNTAEYDKLKNIINLLNNVLFLDQKNSLEIKSDEIIYERNNETFFSKGNTKIIIENKYTLKSKNIFFDRNSQTIYGSEKAIIEDFEGNLYKLNDKFKFNNINKILKTKKGAVIDKNKNKYIYENLVVDLAKKRIAGKEVKVEFEKSYFGIVKNNPVLKGKGVYSDEEQLQLYKAVFSTCNIENKKCRGWEIKSNEFKHDKKKRIFEYKDTWLKIFDLKLFYFPYFNHPDPTVKRKSGFLTPTYTNSTNFGTSINLPYYKVINKEKDITFNPRFYADKSFLLQNEYRQALANSKILSDFSFLVGDAGTKGYLFYNQNGNINEKTKFELNLQKVQGDNFLKNHNLEKTSNLIEDENLLLSNFDLNWSFTDSKLSSSFKIYEDLSRNYHDRYQYIFPDFNFSKDVNIPDEYNGKFLFNTYGFNKNYDTNVNESVITNDFLFKSNEHVNYGISSKYDILLKNTNTHSNNSSNFEDNSNYNLYGTFKIDNSYPLINKTENFTNYLNPILSFRYSPNNNSNLSNKDIILDYNRVFDLNRIGSNYEVEGGESVSLGLEYKRNKNISGKNIVDFKIANVFKIDENLKLPKKSRLDQKRSDIFGNLSLNLIDNVDLGYKFSYDNNLKYSNLEAIDLALSNNFFKSNFSYFTEDFEIDNKETFRNNTIFKVNDENNINFNLTRDLQEDYTQNYSLNYEYLTDCISINLGFNKSFYSDGNLEPNQSISLLIKIIPFTEIGVSNIGKIMSK